MDAALAAFERAVGLDQNFALAYSALGTCYTRLVLTGLGGVDDYKRAAEAYHQALALNDSLIEPRLYLIYGQLLRGEKAQARATLEQLLAQAPNDPKVHNVAADIARWDGQYDKALREYARWLRLSPREAVKVYSGRGRIYAYKRRFEDALAEYEKALALEPNHAFIRCFLAFTKYYLGQRDEAVRLLTRVLDENPQMQFPKIYLAMCYAADGDTARARALITPEVLATGQADGDIAYWLAGLHALLDDRDEALRWLRHAIGIGNENYPWFSFDPNLNSLRDDPRFQEIMGDLRARWEQLTDGAVLQSDTESASIDTRQP
jgi:serine/threonine-protein kinase